MWIMTAFGAFYPCARPRKTIKDGDTYTMQVRARCKDYLEHLNEHYMNNAGEIISGKEATGHMTDYQWRLYCTPEMLTTALGQINDEIIEDEMLKFKPYTESKRGLKDKKLARQLHDTYTSMWSTQLKLSDGTSSWDNWNYYSGQGGQIPRDPWNCVAKELGGIYGCHYFAPGYAKCSDCGKQRPRKFKGTTLSWDEKKDTLPTTPTPAERRKSATQPTGGYYNGHNYQARNGSFCRPGENGWCTATWHTHSAEKKCSEQPDNKHGLQGYCTVHTTDGEVVREREQDIPPFVHIAGETDVYNITAEWYHFNPEYSPIDFNKGENSVHCRPDADGLCKTTWHNHRDQVKAKSDIGPTGTSLKAAPVIEQDGPVCGECGEPLYWEQIEDYCGQCGILIDWENAAEVMDVEVVEATESGTEVPDVLRGVTSE